MKDPKRLLDAAASDSESRLLQAGASEEPPLEALQRMAAKLGLPRTAAESASVASTTTASTRVSGSAPAAAGFGVGAKLTVVLLGAALALAGAVWFAIRPAGVAPGSSRPSPRTSSAAAERDLVQPKTANAPAPLVAAPEQQTTSPDATRALAQEIARVDTIRQLLAADRASAAIIALRDYDRDYPSGALQQEAALLRIEAMHRKGDRGQVRVLAERFLRDHPESPHAPRVRGLAADGANAR